METNFTTYYFVVCLCNPTETKKYTIKSESFGEVLLTAADAAAEWKRTDRYYVGSYLHDGKDVIKYFDMKPIV